MRGVIVVVIAIVVMLNISPNRTSGTGGMGQILWTYHVGNYGAYSFALKPAIGELDAKGFQNFMVFLQAIHFHLIKNPISSRFFASMRMKFLHCKHKNKDIHAINHLVK